MKHFSKNFLFALTLISLLSISAITLAQPTPPPPPPGEKGTSGNQGPSDAPIDGGLVTALVMVAGFGAWKLIKVLRTKPEIS